MTLRRILAGALLAAVPLGTVVSAPPAAAVYCAVTVDEHGNVTVEGPIAACATCLVVATAARAVGQEVYCVA